MKSVELNWCKWGCSGFPSIQTSLLWHVNWLPFYNRSHLGINFQCTVWSLDWYVIHVFHFENASAPLKGYEGKMVASIMLLKRLLFIKTSMCHEGSVCAHRRKSTLVSMTDLWNNSWIMETYFVHIRGIYNPPPAPWKKLEKFALLFLNLILIFGALKLSSGASGWTELLNIACRNLLQNWIIQYFPHTVSTSCVPLG